MATSKVAIVDWKTHPRGDNYYELEAEILGSTADISYHLVADDSDWLNASSLLKDADVVILWHNAPCTATAISTLNNCKVIIRNGVGFDTVDLEAAKKSNITVCNIPDYGTQEVADHAIALALSLARQIIPLDRHAKKLLWELPDHAMANMRRFSDMMFGIVGLGRIGSAVAQKAEALGFNVFYYDPYVNSSEYTKIDTLNELLTITDILSLHCPLNLETRYLIAGQEIDLLKNTSFIVNTARGSIISKRALFNALNGNRLAGAALDVVEDEPLKTIDETKVANLICTCHGAFYSQQSIVDMRTKSANLALAAVLNKPLYNIVSK